MTVQEEADKRRLLSIKRKKEEFKAKEKLIRDALRNVDKIKANKIVFDDNIENDVTTEKGNEKGKRKALFDNEEDDDDKEVNWNDDKFKAKKNLDEKYLKLQASFGNDSRFILDNRFIDEDVEDKEVKEVDEWDIENEKEWQFNILENVLGAPVGKKPKDEEPVKKLAMIRYDPTEDQHKRYELTAEENKLSTKTKKKRKRVEIAEETNRDEPVEVSKDIYYTVSNSLNKSLNQPGEFSLLKKYGKDIDETDNKRNVDAKAKEMPKSKKSFLNFDSKNPFKYDSSDDENEAAHPGIDTTNDKKEKVSFNLFRKDSDNLFFSINDKRFEDALNFFKKESVPKKEFKNLRRELKQIVRAKVRKNVRKTEKWGSRKKIKKLS